MKRTLLMLCAAVLLAGLPAEAAVTRIFEAEKIAVDLPEWWESVQPPPDHALVAIRSPRKKQSFVLLSTRLPPQDAADARRSLLEQMKENVASQGYQLADERPVTSHEIEWLTFNARRPDGNSVTVWTTMIDQKAFLMRADHAERAVAEDPELTAVLHSVRGANPDDAKLPHERSDANLQSKPLLVIALVVVLGAAILVALRPTEHRRRHSTRER